MTWQVIFHPTFEVEFEEFDKGVREELLAIVGLLKLEGPHLRRPQSDTLKGSKHANMKELRFHADDGVWRVAFAFDPTRRAVLLVGADKSGVSEKRFYRGMIRKADERFDEHLSALRQTGRT
jgi:hypothetical protein